ncbi:MAG: hypothetical protein E6356_16970 [Terrisporobacter othiniensis]|nr:hypothetical protein [Terrisporobacter othiniensis]
METKINKELKSLEIKIAKLEKNINTEIKNLKDIVNSEKTYDIINFTNNHVVKLQEYQTSLNNLVEQKETLLYLLDK